MASGTTIEIPINPAAPEAMHLAKVLLIVDYENKTVSTVEVRKDGLVMVKDVKPYVGRPN